MKNTPESRIIELGYELPTAPKALGVYKPVLIAGNYLYVSGQGPLKSDGTLIKGKVGKDLSLEEGKMLPDRLALQCSLQ